MYTCMYAHGYVHKTLQFSCMKIFCIHTYIHTILSDTVSCSVVERNQTFHIQRNFSPNGSDRRRAYILHLAWLPHAGAAELSVCLSVCMSVCLSLTHVHRYIHANMHACTCGVARARGCCPYCVCLSLSRLPN